MKISTKDFLKGCPDPHGMKKLIQQSEDVLKTWDPKWSNFVSAPLREYAIKTMSKLIDFEWDSDGGYSGAERRRMICYRKGAHGTAERKNPAPNLGLLIEGNFLFDRATKGEFLEGLNQFDIEPDGIGDLWITGDRGAQAICCSETAIMLHEANGKIGEVNIRLKSIEIAKLQIPTKRSPRIFETVEASTRIDAIASAGFGVSRAKIGKRIEEGYLRLNWSVINRRDRELCVGDKMHLENRGALEVLDIKETKRQRWKIKLLRK